MFGRRRRRGGAFASTPSIPMPCSKGRSIWDGRWRDERAATYGIAPDQLEEHYRKRTVLGVNVVPADIAEAVAFLASQPSRQEHRKHYQRRRRSNRGIHPLVASVPGGHCDIARCTFNSASAVDLGAETGRADLGRRSAKTASSCAKCTVSPTVPSARPTACTGMRWAFSSRCSRASNRAGSADRPIVSLGVDSWGVDYGLFDGRGRLLGNPYHYRDSRTDGMREMYAERVSAARQYALTGIAQMSINTLYQLAAQKSESDGALGIARSLLMIPDIMHYWLTGTQVAEFTNASTSGLLAVDGTWADESSRPIDMPRGIFGEPVEPATILGPTAQRVRCRSARPCAARRRPGYPRYGLRGARRAAARRRRGDVCAYISSGTWSLLGSRTDAADSHRGRPPGGIHQRTRRRRQRSLSAQYHGTVAGPGVPARLAPRRRGRLQLRRPHRACGDGRIARAHHRRGRSRTAAPRRHARSDRRAARAQRAASAERDPVALTRAIFEGLALQYRRSIADAQRLAGVRVGAVAIIGGGSRNTLLCQLAADACARVVYAGPAEASATGNVLVQGVADRALSDLAQIRDFVKTTARPRIFEPRSATTIDWAARDAALSSLRQSGTPERTPHV